MRLALLARSRRLVVRGCCFISLPLPLLVLHKGKVFFCILLRGKHAFWNVCKWFGKDVGCIFVRRELASSPPPLKYMRMKLFLHLKPHITNAHASDPEFVARRVAHSAGRTRFVFRGRPPNPRPVPKAPCSGQREKPRTADDKQLIF